MKFLFLMLLVVGCSDEVSRTRNDGTLPFTPGEGDVIPPTGIQTIVCHKGKTEKVVQSRYDRVTGFVSSGYTDNEGVGPSITCTGEGALKACVDLCEKLLTNKK